MASMYSAVSKHLPLTGAGKLSQTPEPIFNAQHLFGSTNLHKHEQFGTFA